MDHFEIYQLLSDKQLGFIKGYSTTSAIIALADYIIKNLESGKLVTSVIRLPWTQVDSEQARETRY